MVNGVKLFFAISKFGAPGEIRTPDQPVRSRLLYPAELRAPSPSLACAGDRVRAGR